MLEKDIQKSIIDYLRLKGWLVIKHNNVGIYKKKTDSYIPVGQLGVADLLVCSPAGRFVAIEVKTPKGKLSAHQEAFLKSVQGFNGIAMVARSIDDVIEFVEHYEKFGVPDKMELV